jgi:hypothetical protein
MGSAPGIFIKKKELLTLQRSARTLLDCKFLEQEYSFSMIKKFIAQLQIPLVLEIPVLVVIVLGEVWNNLVIDDLGLNCFGKLIEFCTREFRLLLLRTKRK